MVTSTILATTTLKEDNRLEYFAKKHGLDCYRGEEQDVLARYYGAATEFRVKVIARICADDPLIDPRIIDVVIHSHLDSDADYTSNGIVRTFPLGLDAEVFSYGALEKAYNEARKGYEREHVTPYIYLHPEIFKLKSVEATGKLRRPDLRLTVDAEEDLRLIREIFKRLYREGKLFYTEDVIDLLDRHPEMVAINAHVVQKELGQ
jgi:spore coat polysaccharide biosynthesis protein SpsF